MPVEESPAPAPGTRALAGDSPDHRQPAATPKEIYMIGAIILGLLAGYIAKALLPGDAPVGFFIFTELLGIGDTEAFDLGGLIGAIIGTMLLLLAYRQFAGGRDRTRPA